LSTLKKVKKPLAAAVLLPAAYVADVWLLGSAAAVLYDAVANIKQGVESIFGSTGVPVEVDNLFYYWQHPFSVAQAWLTKPGTELALPQVRKIWLGMNIVLIIPAVTMFIKNKQLRLQGDKNDARHVHGLEVADNPAYGTTRWAGPGDMAHICEFGPPRRGSGGIVLGKLENKIIRVIPGRNIRKEELGLTGHVVAYGVTGSGKSFTFVRNNMIAGVEDGQSLVLIDPKGELYETMGRWLESNGYEVYLFNLVNPERSHRWNPIAECRDDEEIAEMSACMIENAAKDSHGYFVNKEIQLYEALAGLLKNAFPALQAHPRSVMTLASWSREKLEQVFLSMYREKKISETIYERWRGAASANLEEAKSGLTAKLKIITTKSLAALMSEQEIDLDGLGREKTALFCVLPVKGSAVLKPILSVFYMFLFNRLYELADKNGGRLPVEVRIILDEFANVGKIPGFSEKISTARSLGILLQYILQGRSQLDDVYGVDGARNILASTPISLLLGVAPDDEVTQGLFSNKLGEAAVRIRQYRKDVSTPAQTIELPKKSIVVGRRKLMEKYEIKEMNTKYCIADIQAARPMFLRKLGWIELPQAKEIMACGTSPIAEIPPRSLDIALPAAELHVAAGAGTGTGVLWEVNKHKASQSLESTVEFSLESRSQTAETIVREEPEEIQTQTTTGSENPGEEMDDVDSQGFNVSSPIF